MLASLIYKLEEGLSYEPLESWEAGNTDSFQLILTTGTDIIHLLFYLFSLGDHEEILYNKNKINDFYQKRHEKVHNTINKLYTDSNNNTNKCLLIFTLNTISCFDCKVSLNTYRACWSLYKAQCLY